MRRAPIYALMAMLVLILPSPAWATHSLDVTTAPTAFLLSPTKVHVSGTLTCVGSAESGSVGVVLIQPPGGVTLNGGGSTPFSCSGGERVSWAVVVTANEFSTFTSGMADFDAFANTDCSDEEVDCPSVGIDGTLQIKRAPTCFGETATILGNSGDERIEGTPGTDVIIGRGGRDIVFAGEGDDLICGNAGSDVIDGGGGDDHMSGAFGPDFITGVDGNDQIRGGVGNDVLNFGDEEDGDDVVVGGGGDDDLHAGVGLDRLLGNDGKDTLSEGEVDAPMVDLFSGGAGIDTCSPGAEDQVRGCENQRWFVLELRSASPSLLPGGVAK
jgi:RTX calcium-binding nonapeptide repeat (4 copies)